MYGALHVVEDLSDDLSGPKSYFSRHILLILDDLLESSRPREEWTFNELAPGVTPAFSGRSYTTGRQLFLAASFVTCHRINGVGEVIGPDLTKLDLPQLPSEILRNILNPSEKINEKYRTFRFETQLGRVVTDLVLEEKGGKIKVIKNPLVKSEPVAFEKSATGSSRRAHSRRRGWSTS